ncbi:MAG: Na+/H+ antiporter NhaA [Solirubrobacterales bacterium]|nr:Na+/H+ antiporter NhaA [Solirubrobacterales bacterium]
MTDPYGGRGLRVPESFPRPWLRSDQPVPRRLVRPVERFLSVEAGSGSVLLLAAVAALIWANVSAEGYEGFWGTEISLTAGSLELTESLRDWVNDLLMAIFFFLISLEVKREVLFGDLSDRRVAAAPIAAAIGGMILPALLFLLLNMGEGGSPSGWAIPIATDVAFALALLATIGRMAPGGLRSFLLTVAIVDDIGTIVVIALFFTDDLSLAWLAVAAGLSLAVWLMSRVGIRHLAAYVAAAAVLWVAVFESGVHATIAGVILGFLTPSRPFHRPDPTARVIAEDLDELERTDDAEVEEGTMISVARLAGEAASPLNRMEERLHPWSAYLILPLFALANAGIPLSASVLGAVFTEPLGLGILVGLLVGKPLGIFLASFAAVRLAGARLPEGIGFSALPALGLVAGIGFTVAIFISDLAFSGAELAEAKAAILVASALASLLAVLAFAARRAFGGRLRE